MEKAQSSLLSRFFKGLVSSATSSTLMMGIFYGLKHLAGTAGLFGLSPLTAAIIPEVAMVIAAVAIFGGVMAVMRGDKHHASSTERNQEAQQSVMIANGRGLAQTITPAGPMADQVDAPATNQQRWTDRPDIAQSNRTSIAQILADGKSPKDHAAAILASQQTSTAASR